MSLLALERQLGHQTAYGWDERQGRADDFLKQESPLIQPLVIVPRSVFPKGERFVGVVGERDEGRPEGCKVTLSSVDLRKRNSFQSQTDGRAVQGEAGGKPHKVHDGPVSLTAGVLNHDL